MKLILLIPHYNDPEGLNACLQSIEEDFLIDVLIVDDGSSIKPAVDNLSAIYTGGKLNIIYLETNLGIEHALNTGLKEIQNFDYKYIGRLDCGDLCYPHRFRKQCNYLEKNPEVKLLGTQAQYADPKGKIKYTSRQPLGYKVILKGFYYNCQIIHPTVVFRTEILAAVGYYPTSYRAAEDYAFFFKILKKFTVENLDEVLLLIRMNPEGISFKYRKRQVLSKIHIIWDNFYWGFYPVFGLIRNMSLLLFPRNLIISFKELIRKY